MKQSALLKELKSKTNNCIQEVKLFQLGSDYDLRKSTNLNSWNTLQCIEHLNRYGKFYLPEFQKRIRLAKQMNSDIIFNSTFWGRKFCNMMLPKDNKIKKMKTFKSKNPINNKLKNNTLIAFIKQQEEMIKALEEAENLDLNTNKCALTIPLVKMNLGDTFRFVIYHNVRHIEQAKRAFQLEIVQ